MNYVAGSTTATSTANGGWLPLLSWSPSRAANLPAIVERVELEPHPVSGEIELEDVRPAKYRRLDDETLHARLDVEQFELSPVYLWCETDNEEGSTGPGWKLAELRSLEDATEEEASSAQQWHATISEANDAASTRSISVPQQRREVPDAEEEDEEDDNEDYWASYDKTPGQQTPAPRASPAPPTTRAAGNDLHENTRDRSKSELEYFSRYGTEVQPAMDGHDPDEEHPDIGESTLTGDALVRGQPQASSALQTNGHSNGDADHELSMPRAISPTSSVDKLEAEAEATDRAHLGVKQHISTDIKSLFRLARSVGMERREFERVVKLELDALGFMEADD